MHSKDPSVFTFSLSALFLPCLVQSRASAVEGGEGGARLELIGGRKKKGEGRNCAGRKDALVAAASDSISMNFTAEAAAAAIAAATSSDSLSKPAAALCAGAPRRGPVAAPHLPPTLESSV